MLRTIVVALGLLALTSSVSAGYLMLTSFGREVSMLDVDSGSLLRCKSPLDQVPTTATPLFGLANPADKGSAIMCGGEKRAYTLAHEHNSECFMVKPNSNGDDWTTIGRLEFGRNLGTIIDLDENKFWVLGGSTNVGMDDHVMGTTEIVTIEDDVLKQSVKGPRMPKNMIFMCTAHLDDKRIFVAGTDLGRQYAYIVNKDNLDEFQEIKVSKDRLGAMCAKIRSDGKEYIVLFGGYKQPYGAGQASPMTELYDIKSGRVTRGPDMPKAVFTATYSGTDGSKIVVAGGLTGLKEDWGFSFATYTFDGKKWSKLPTPLYNAFGRHQGIYFEDFKC